MYLNGNTVKIAVKLKSYQLILLYSSRSLAMSQDSVSSMDIMSQETYDVLQSLLDSDNTGIEC